MGVREQERERERVHQPSGQLFHMPHVFSKIQQCQQWQFTKCTTKSNKNTVNIASSSCTWLEPAFDYLPFAFERTSNEEYGWYNNETRTSDTTFKQPTNQAIHVIWRTRGKKGSKKDNDSVCNTKNTYVCIEFVIVCGFLNSKVITITSAMLGDWQLPLLNASFCTSWILLLSSWSVSLIVFFCISSENILKWIKSPGCLADIS